MCLKIKLPLMLTASLSIFIAGLNLIWAQESFPLQVEVIENNINIRCDSTVRAQIICKVNRGDTLTALSEFYDWYRVRLPKSSPAFIKDGLAEAVDSKTIRVTKSRVNIRLGPTQSSPIIGRAKKDQVFNLLSQASGWYRVEPSADCFGWLHRRFARKATALPEAVELKNEDKAALAVPGMPVQEDVITIVGTVTTYSRIFKKAFTHRIITPDNRIFLLKAEKILLGPATGHKTKITGKINPEVKQKYPVLEVIQMEVLD